MQRIILDTDPGIDDALALFLALASPEITLEAITTVQGNVSLEQTTYNALTLLTLAGRTDIPVAYGCTEPLVRARVNAAHVHGLNGLGDIKLPEPTIAPMEQQAVDLIIEKIMNNPGEIALVAIGPLTNIALAVRREPRIAQHVREIVIMGGAVCVPGNVTPNAEFNIFADPHAAHIVFHAGWPLRLVSLDVTTRVSMQRQHVETLAAHGGKVTTAIQQMMVYYFDVFGPAFGSTTFQMHDPLCLAAAFQPDLITWERAYVDVELAGTLTLGETVGYFKRPNAPIPNMQLSVGVDSERFLNLFLERIGKTFGEHR
ncbi:MAG: nucleoside hydrolase [Ktedonobacteraceae bacterium]